MAKLKIEGNHLMLAVDETPYGELMNYLNTETGEIILVHDNEINGGEIEVDDVDEYLESGPFVYIQPIGSDLAFEIMDDFVDTLPAGTARSRLREALSGNKPFRRFKDAMHNLPDVYKSWNRFEEIRHREYLTDLIAGFGVDAEIEWGPLPEAPAPEQIPQKERVLAEFTWARHKSVQEVCRITARKSKKGVVLHIDHYNGDMLIHEGIAMSPEDIDTLIDALKQVKTHL